MTTQQPSRIMPRRFGILALGSMAVLAACESQIPTATEVAAMNVSSVEQRVGTLLPASDVPTQYFIDGVASSREAATALTPDQIATIEVRRVVKKEPFTASSSTSEAPTTGAMEMYLTTKAASGAAGASNTSAQVPSVNFTMVPSTKAGTETKPMMIVQGAPVGSVVSGGAMDGVADEIAFIMIDGVRQDRAAMQRVKPADIVTIEIIKGPAAVAKYGDSAAKGVIVVTTKGAPK